MIKVPVRKQIKEGKAPFTHYWQFTDPCVQLVSSVINFDNIVEAVIAFRDQACYDLNPIGTLYVEDAEGCKISQNIAIQNPCDGYDFLFTPNIQEIANLKFKAAVPAKYAPFVFQWTVDSAAFYVKDQYADTMELGIAEGASLTNGDVIQLKVSVTNQYGCCIEATYDMVVCAPTILDMPLNLTCDTVDCPDKQCTRLILPVSGCETSTECNPSFRVPIDWDSFRVQEIPSGITMELIDDKRGMVLITAPADYPQGTYVIKYSVADINGVTSYGELCVTTEECGGSKFQIQGGLFQFGCKDCEASERATAKDLAGSVGFEECSGQTLEIPLEDRLVEATPKDVDWSTFTFMPLPGQVMISPTQITSDYALITFDPDRKIVYAPFNPAQNIFENVRFRMSTRDGREAQASFLFEDDFCGNAPIAKDNEYQVREGGLLDVNVTVNDTGNVDSVVFQGPIPGNGQGQLTLDPSTGRLRYSAVGNNLPDEWNMTYYLVDTQGRVSNTANIKIIINKDTVATAANRSYCPIDAEGVDLYDLLDTEDDSRYWKFKGFNGLEDGTFSYNGNPETTYEAGHTFEPKTFAMLADFSNSDPGLYTFLYTKGTGNAQVSTEITIEIVEPQEMPERKDRLACITESAFYLENLFEEGELPAGGTWINLTPFGNTLTSTKIDPGNLGAGIFNYRYTIENFGEYNQVCDSYVDVVIEIANEVYAGEDICIKVCSAGPDPTEDPDICRDPRIVLNGSETCEVCLWDRMYAAIDPKTQQPKVIHPYGKWYLKDAPLSTGNVLVVNGAVQVVDKGGEIAGGHLLCIDFGNMAIGKYDFEYVVSNGCEDRSTFRVVVLPEPCQVEDVTGVVVELTGDEQKTLYNIMIENLDPSGCLPTIRGYWDQLEGPDGEPYPNAGVYLDDNGDSRDDYIKNGEATPGKYKFKLTYYPDNIETEYCQAQECIDDCDACEQEVILEFELNPCPDLGEARNMGVCNSGHSCKMPLQELAPNANYGEPGVEYFWRYAGFASTDPNQPNIFEVGSIPDVQTTKGSMWAVDERIYANHTSPAPDTDENPIIEWNGALEGFYFFDLVAQGEFCEETLRAVVQVVTVTNPGLDGQCLTLCDNSPECIDLWCLLTGTPGSQGQWTIKSAIDCDGTAVNVPSASGPCAGNAVAGKCDPCSEKSPVGDPGFYNGIGNTASFNTDGIPCGIYVFEYTSTVPPLTQGFILFPCSDGCDPQSAEVTIQILDGDEAGFGGGAEVCN